MYKYINTNRGVIVNKVIILSVVFIILCGGIAYGQDDSVPKNVQNGSIQSSGAETDSIYDGYYLGQNYPNPFWPTTAFGFGVSDTSDVKIVVYDIEWRALRTLLDTLMAPGSGEMDWDGRDDDGNVVEKGVYFIRMDARNQKVHFKKSRKYILLH
jgi:hypothetical protein